MQRVTKLKRNRKNDWSPQKVAEYSSIINAQQDNFMTGPKVLLPLSAGGIGLLVGVSNSFVFLSTWQVIAFACSILGFAMTILFIIGIYGCKFKLLDTEKQLLVNNIKERDMLIKSNNELNKEHASLGIWIACLFMFSILSMTLFGGIFIIGKYNLIKGNNNIKSVKVVNKNNSKVGM